ncbi:MAG: polyprenol monophosphomannose synthase [Flavobacteriales bacterium]|nr:polyprenol monophosphomannose synthase [Flavobacteriales bacterium]
MSSKIVIIPTYNEIENIEDIIRVVIALEEDFHILVVDDSSPDGTNQKVKQLQAEFPENLFLEIRKEKQGLGKAYIHGFKWCLQRNYDYIFQMDADFSHNPHDLIRLHKTLINDADMVIGSRYSHGVNVVNWPMSRVLLSYGASIYARVITGIPVYDTTAGFVGYKQKVLTTLNLDKIKFSGYGFQIEMKFKTWKENFRVKEIPIVFTDRTKGKSKLSIGIIREAIFGIIELKFKYLFKRKK